MKKIFLFAMAALVLVALVACGGETTTETTTTQAPATTTTTEPVESSTTPVSTTETPIEDGEEPLYKEGINILNGDIPYMAIEAFKMSERAVAFENWHEALGFNWAVVIAMCESEQNIIAEVLDYDTETGLAPARQEYKWVLVINGEEKVVTNFYNSASGNYVYVRMDLGQDWTFEQGSKDYDISLKICDYFSDEIVYWAYLTDPNLAGVYSFAPPTEIDMIPDPDGGAGEDEYLLTKDMIELLAGPEQTAAGEFYGAIFDGNAGTKLCTRDMTKDIIFAISDSVYNPNLALTSISIVGANDDENRPNRAITKFILYGADSGDEDADWQPVLTVDIRDSFIATNYGERHYVLPEASNYQYYKLVVLDPQLDEGREHKGPIYQFSELLLYVETASIAG